MHTLLNRNLRRGLVQILILLVVMGLIFTPPVLTGYSELEAAESSLQRGEFPEAAAEFSRAARLLPWRTDLWEAAARMVIFGGDPETSIPLFEMAARKNGLSQAGWENYGQAYWMIKDLDAAEEVWLTGLETYPTYPKYYLHLSRIYFERGDITAERDALENWFATGSKPDAAAHYRLALLLSAAEPERATSQFTLASSLDPDYEDAVETILTALNLASLEIDESRRKVIIGRGLGLLNEWTLAADAFRQAVVTDEENAEAWAWLGEAEQHLDRDGLKELDKALSLDREDPVVRSLRGLYWSRQGRPQPALAEYLLAAEYDPENPAWQISIAEAYVQNGDLVTALEHYRNAAEIAPTDATAWRILALFCIQYGVQIEEIGVPAAQMAVDLSGEDPLALDTLGQALTRLGHFEEAQEVLEHALSLDPDFAQAYLHLGIIAIQSEDWEMAKDYLLKAHDLGGAGAAGDQAQVLLNQYFP